MEATDLLLELLVKISTHPDQWEHVHNFLRNLDNDLQTSKKILNEVYNLDGATMKVTAAPQKSAEGEIELNKKTHSQNMDEGSINKEYINPPKETEDGTHKFNEEKQKPAVNPPRNSSEVQKMVVILSGGQKHRGNTTEKVLDSNRWPVFESEKSDSYDETDLGKYPWQLQGKSPKNAYPHNFAYHRVTGQPYASNYNKNPKAYIAVSVIAPKPLGPRSEDELALENELRQLKPWTHKQNLKQELRNRWTMQTEGYNYTP